MQGRQPAEDPDAEEVRAALARLLASRGFAKAPRLQRFLSHVVEHRLRGDCTSLKEYALGFKPSSR